VSWGFRTDVGYVFVFSRPPSSAAGGDDDL
jgi:hypothetical protein